MVTQQQHNGNIVYFASAGGQGYERIPFSIASVTDTVYHKISTGFCGPSRGTI